MQQPRQQWFNSKEFVGLLRKFCRLCSEHNLISRTNISYGCVLYDFFFFGNSAVFLASSGKAFKRVKKWKKRLKINVKRGCNKNWLWNRNSPRNINDKIRTITQYYQLWMYRSILGSRSRRRLVESIRFTCETGFLQTLVQVWSNLLCIITSGANSCVRRRNFHATDNWNFH